MAIRPTCLRVQLNKQGSTENVLKLRSRSSPSARRFAIVRPSSLFLLPWSLPPMRWQSWAILVGLLACWAAFAAWQYERYLHERQLIEETLHQQSHSVMNALIGGVRSHRRAGPFFADQLQGMLDEFVRSPDVLAVALAAGDGQTVSSAGNIRSLDISRLEPGDDWEATGFRLVEKFQLPPAPPGGRGLGGGRGWGQGAGRFYQNDARPDALAAGGEFTALLLLDRTRSDMLLRRALWSHAVGAMAGTLVLVCVALTWWASVRLVAARGQARVFEAETRYFRELSQAAAGLAHETRNPLGLIRGWTQRLAKPDIDAAEREQRTHAVIEECDRVTVRINQFLAFARPLDPAPQSVDVDGLIDELAAILQPDLEIKQLTLMRESSRPAAPVQADRELLRQALFNLLQNAIQFSPAGEAVGVAVVARHNGVCRIEVRDRGPGVAEQHVKSLFTPYFTTRPDGTGLGLAIVRRIAAVHGWTVDHRPRPGGGAVFFLDGIHG